MISAKELREGNCNQETVERGLILIDKLVKENRMKGFVEIKLSKVFYNEYEFDAIVEKLRFLGFFTRFSFEQNVSNFQKHNLNREFTLMW